MFTASALEKETILERLRGLAARSRWLTEDVRFLLEAHKQSGLGQLEFCRQTGIPLERLKYQLKKSRGADGKAQSFVPVSLISAGGTKVLSSSSADARCGSWRINPAADTKMAPALASDSIRVVFPNGCSVFVSPNFDEAALVRLVNVIGGATC